MKNIEFLKCEDCQYYDAICEECMYYDHPDNRTYEKFLLKSWLNGACPYSVIGEDALKNEDICMKGDL